MSGRKKNIGFTLIELLIFMGLFSILIMVIMNIFTSSLETKMQTESSSVIHQDGRFIIEKFMNDLNNANDITFPSLGSTSSSLDFTLYGAPQTLRLNNNNIELINANGTYILNSYDTNVTDLTFTRLGNPNGRNSVRISFTLQSKIIIGNQPKVESFQVTSGLR